MSWKVAPAVEKPVLVLIKSAPASTTMSHIFSFSSSVSRQVSMMTLSTLSPTAALTAAMSARTSSYCLFFSQPMLMTMSTSAAPFSTAVFASKALLLVSMAPSGKPTTQHTGTRPAMYSTAWRT